MKGLVKKFLENKNLLVFEEGKNWRILKKNIEQNKFTIVFENKNYEFDFPSLFGDHQIENASTAISTVLSLKEYDIPKKYINRGIQKATWPARMQNLDGRLSKLSGNNFDIWLDGGHNLDASNIILKTIQGWQEKKVILIMGMVFGKDPINFLNKIIKYISFLIILPIDDHQYLMPYQIKNDVLKKFQPMFDISCCLNIDEAIKHVKQKFTHGKILICGSLYLAGEVLRADGYKIK